MIYYKVTGPDGESIHGGDLRWSLPDGDTPGDWHAVEGRIALCDRGLHLTCEPARWWQEGARCFVAEYEGEPLGDGADKICVRRARLVRELTRVELASVHVYLEGAHQIDSPTYAYAGGSSSVVALGSSSVVAGGSSSIVALGSSSVEAWGSSRVVAWGSSSVEARESSSVEAWGSSSVVAGGSSSVVAWESSSVEAWGSSRVVARGSSRVVARGSSSVEARGSSSVEARGSSSVEARGSSSVVAWESSSVVALESSSVEAWGSSRVVSPRGAWGHPTVAVHDFAVWVDQREGKPVIHAVAAELVEVES